MGLYASAEYVAQHGMPQGPEDRENRAPYFQWMAAHVPERAVTYRCTDSHAMRAALLAGAGMGFLNPAEAARLADLVEVHSARPEWSANLWLVTHVDLHRTTKVQALLKFIKDRTKGGLL